MKFLSLLMALFAICQTTIAQQDWADRLVVDPALAPFYHGVASGDPTAESVMIWTRVSPNDELALRPNVTLTVDWFVSTTNDINTFFDAGKLVQQGTTATDASRDYTVNIEVTGLEENRWYYYIFRSQGEFSIMGRTRTFPADQTAVNNLRFGVVSCSNFPIGFFNAYDDLAERNDVDAIFHLGDYIYEYGNDIVAPDHEMVSLDDYRTRYSFYRLDSMLRKAHQQYQWITIWDDHESTNNSWVDGAENHDPDNAYDEDDPSLVEGEWEPRKNISKQVYQEWMPIRQDLINGEPLYRDFSIGQLGDLFFLDTRLEGREEQLATPTPASLQADRTLLGNTQYEWLTESLLTADGTWKIVPQQVMMAPLAVGDEDVPVNMDQWDGYHSERQKLFNYVEDQNIDNMVVLTGDIHTSWAMELPHDRNAIEYTPGVYDTNGSLVVDCNRSRGVEFVVWSVTSNGFPDGTNPSVTAIQAGNPHMKYVNIEDHGYMILDVKPNRTQCDWVQVSTLASTDYERIDAQSWFVEAGETCLQQAQSPSAVPAGQYPAVAPADPPAASNDALAVDYLDFYGYQQNAINYLVWKTSRENNVKNFQIERSADGTNFTKIGTVASKNQATNAYTFVDNNPLQNITYYRIVEFANDGKTQTSAAIAIRTDAPLGRHTFYPNPAEDYTLLSFHNPQADAVRVELYSLEGQLMKTTELEVAAGNQQLRLNLSDVPQGVYTAKVFHAQSGKVGGGMIVKVK